jgi:hypothetical protein
MFRTATTPARPGSTWQRLAHRATMLGLLLSGLWLAADPALAQLHRCVIDGRTTFSDKPCPGAAVDVRPSDAGGAATTSTPAAGAPTAGGRAAGATAAAAQPAGTPAAGTPTTLPPAGARPGATAAGDPDLARRCAAGNAAACRTQQTLERHQRDMDELAQHCAGGSARACDAIACVKQNDRAACARVEGRAASPAPGPGSTSPGPTATGWHETGRRVESRPGRRLDGGVTADRITVVSIRCGHGGLGQVEVGNGGARIGGHGQRYDSLDEAAARMCARAP